LSLIITSVYGFSAPRKGVMNLLHFIDRLRHLVFDRLQRAEISDDRIQIALADDLVKIGRHDHRELHAIWTHAGAQRRLDLRVGPGANTGLLILRDVRRFCCACAEPASAAANVAANTSVRCIDVSPKPF
jgi:hypothetical protein